MAWDSWKLASESEWPWNKIEWDSEVSSEVKTTYILSQPPCPDNVHSNSITGKLEPTNWWSWKRLTHVLAWGFKIRIQLSKAWWRLTSGTCTHAWRSWGSAVMSHSRCSKKRIQGRVCCNLWWKETSKKESTTEANAMQNFYPMSDFWSFYQDDVGWQN